MIKASGGLWCWGCPSNPTRFGGALFALELLRKPFRCRGKKPGFSEKPRFTPFKPQIIERVPACDRSKAIRSDHEPGRPHSLEVATVNGKQIASVGYPSRL